VSLNYSCGGLYSAEEKNTHPCALTNKKQAFYSIDLKAKNLSKSLSKIHPK